jgi:hypothetical protein
MVVVQGYDPCRPRSSGGSRALIRRARSPEPTTLRIFGALEARRKSRSRNLERNGAAIGSRTRILGLADRDSSR